MTRFSLHRLRWLMVIPLLLACYFTQAQIRVSNGEIVHLSVESIPNHTYSWELYNNVEGINFATIEGNAPPNTAYFVNGNIGNSVSVKFLQPGEYFYKVTVRSFCTNNIKIGKVIVSEADVSGIIIDKSANKNVITEVGEEIIYSIVVSNRGDISINDFSVTDPLTELERNFSKLLPGDSIVIQTSYYVTPADLRNGYIENVATLTGKTIGDKEFEITAEKAVTVVFANLSISKTVDNAKPIIGENVRFTITVTNNSSVVANGVKVLDEFPSGYTYVSDESDGNYNTETSIWDVGTLEPGESKELSYLLKVNRDGDYINIAQVMYNSLDADTIDNIDKQATIPENPLLALEIPEIFSPNGDGIQDYFRIKGIEYFPNAKIEIYNRWGNLVYSKENYGNTDVYGNTAAWWDGKSNQGMLISDDTLPAGTYFYVLRLGEWPEPISGYVFLNNN